MSVCLCWEREFCLAPFWVRPVWGAKAEWSRWLNLLNEETVGKRRSLLKASCEPVYSSLALGGSLLISSQLPVLALKAVSNGFSIRIVL